LPVILLIDDNKVRSKKLCDMLNKERIIPVGSKQQVFEALVHHKGKLNAIVANVRAVQTIISEQTISQLCEKLYMDMPPIVGLYSEEEEQLLQTIPENDYHITFVKYDEKDMNFPVKYIKAIKKVYQDLSADINKANEVWLKSTDTQDLIDIREWLKDEGFLDVKHKKAPLKSKKITHSKPASDAKIDYKKMYLELKEKYEELKKKYDEVLKYIQDLTDSV
jgi:3-methyladenine DNA glycosylase Tag